ncbi:MAG: ATP-binding protein [Deltaproteobacteria bacterium]|nr:ATP-binding protein [Deltaproteobacteria bacterium]
MERTRYETHILKLLRRYPIVCLVGARQVGKTTLARHLAAARPSALYDLESPEDVARLSDALFELRRQRGLVVLDEMQRMPELFPVLRVLADERPLRRRFLLLGSASPALLRQGAESLAGRIAFMEISPFALSEVPRTRWERLWVRGGFPGSFLATSEAASFEWRRLFRQTFVERDLPALDLPSVPAPSAIGRFWAMLAHVHAELLSWSELGRSMGVSDATARRYADLLEGALMVRQLKPWHENISKRQVKSPKLYFRDSGLLHAQLGLRTKEDLLRHPRVGASFEGFVIEQIIAAAGATSEDAYFWRTQHGAELDLLLVKGRRRVGFEIKRTSAPTLTPSMRAALADLRLDTLFVVHGGDHSFRLANRVEAIPWTNVLEIPFP